MQSEVFFKNLQEFNAKYSKALEILVKKRFDQSSNQLIDLIGVKEAYIKAVTDFTNNPAKFFEHNLEYASKVSKLMFNVMDKISGEEVENLYRGDPKDRRFKGKSWEESLYFNFIKQFYFMSSEWHRSLIAKLEVSESQRKLLSFYTEQVINAASPSNFLNLNPEALNELILSNGQNLLQGIENFLEDLKISENFLAINMCPKNAFELGKNIACSKGKVIFQNEMMQLICYQPESKVHTIPIFVIPPWINKFYILDLGPENSFIKHIVNAGFQVFLVSWVNPDSKLSHKNFEDYLKEGVNKPIEFLIENFGYKKFNILAYCIGGTLATCAASYYKAKKREIFNTLTLLTTMLDFSEAGDLGLFINKDTISAINDTAEKNGYLSGKVISQAFSLLRANELIWAFAVNNYLLGKKPNAFDLLHWNSDSTNLPRAMHKFYLENMYLENNLIKNGGITLLDVPIDLRRIDVPVFFVSCIEDHITPWRSTFKGTSLLAKKPKEEPVFCLSGSGHIAGIINPPKNRKYNYYLNDKLYKDPNEWLENSVEYEGSWWDAWLEWLISRSGKKIDSLNYSLTESLEEAPGSYVKKLI
ncbi:MAG: class I poly(R)-hydroxyalkanoic acid synthase [Rickettsiaceae bacterium]|nr:class I poly(R)-hydroxyalkanoic acid synthase [Rickettsiaceae bacterium]